MSATVGAPLLPAAFADLERFIGFALPTEKERYLKRLQTPMEELRDFYETGMERAEEARDHLDKYDLESDSMPIEAQRLLWLLFSLISAYYAVEVFGQQRVPDTESAYMERVGEPVTFPV
jgi:hypothetical protein